MGVVTSGSVIVTCKPSVLWSKPGLQAALVDSIVVDWPTVGDG